MAIKKVVEIDVDVVRANGGLENFTQNFKKSEEAAKSLRTQLREAQLEVATLSEKFGATSREAVEAAKKAAVLKDRIGDAKALTDAFNPDAKFKALSGSLTGVAGGFSVVTGLMGTLGAESKEVEGAILKVQSAMAIASGAQAIGESIDSFKQLGAVVRSFSIVQKISAAAQMVWNAAMAANPIGAIVAVVVALIAAGYALVKMFIASSEATKNAEAANKALNKELDTQVKNQKLATQEADLSRDAQLKMAKASGQSAAEIRKLSLELANQEVAQKMANAQTLRAIAIEAMRVAGMEDATEAEKETAKNALKEFNDANNALKASVLNRRKLIIDNRVAEVQEATDAREKKKEADKKAGQEDLAEQEKLAKEKIELEKSRLQKINDLYASYLKANQDASAVTEQQKLDLQKQRDLEEINQLAKTETEKANLKALFDEKYFNLQKQLDEKLAEDKAKKDEEKIEKEDDEWLRLQELTLEKNDYDALVRQQKFEAEYIAAEGNNELQIALKNDYLQKEVESEKANADAEIKIEEEKQAAKQKALQAFSSGLKTAATLLGESTAAGKAMAVAATTIDTIQSGVSAFKGMVSAVPGPVGIGLGAVAAAGALASGYASVKKILAVKTPGGGGGGGGIGGGGVAPPPPPPQFNIVGQSSTNQLSQTIATQQNRPIQTYVVGNQVSTQQSLDRNAVATSTFG